MHMNTNNGNPKIGIFSFFAGVGFLDLGFEKTPGYEVMFVNEYIPEFADAHRYARKEMELPIPEYGYGVDSVEDYKDGERSEWLKTSLEDARKKKDLIGFIAGPPCPDFSVGGKNRGSTGDHGRLSTIYFDVIEKHEPDFFLFENVKGLWRTKKHREFYEQLKERARESGYVTTEHLFNARTFGAPQDRDRIILLGIKQKLLPKSQYEVGVINEELYPWLRNAKYDLLDIKTTPWPRLDIFEENGFRAMPMGIKEDLTVEHWFKKNDVLNHPNGNDFFQPKAALPKFQVIEEGDTNKKSYKRLHRWRYSPTCAYGNNEVHLHPYKARRISVAEALSLQSLPKEFVLPPYATLTGKFKMIGNGVPFLLSKGVAENLIYYLQRNLNLKDFEDDIDSSRISNSNRPTAEEPTVLIR